MYMADNPWGADRGSSYETWLHFISGPGWAPSGIIDANGVRTGVDAASWEEETQCTAIYAAEMTPEKERSNSR